MAILSTDFRQAVLDAKSEDSKGHAYQALFEHKSAADLQSLKSDVDIGISLQAAWEDARKPIARPKKSQYRVDTIYDPAATLGFVAFLSQRTGLSVPEWWKAAFLEVDYFPGQHHAFFRPISPYDEILDGSGRVSRGVTVAFTKTGVSFASNGIKVTIARDIDVHADTYAVLLEKDRSYIVPLSYGSGGFGYTLRALDSRTGEVVWSSPGWAAGRRMLMGLSFHAVSIVHSAHLVVVFGAESHGAYVEAYDDLTGKCLYRFCSCYWFNFPEAWNVRWGKMRGL